MSPRHIAERRALYRAIEASADCHIRPRIDDPICVHSPRSTVAVCGNTLWLRRHQGPTWCVQDVSATAAAPWSTSAVVDDFGTLVEVPAA